MLNINRIYCSGFYLVGDHWTSVDGSWFKPQSDPGVTFKALVHGSTGQAWSQAPGWWYPIQDDTQICWYSNKDDTQTLTYYDFTYNMFNMTYELFPSSKQSNLAGGLKASKIDFIENHHPKWQKTKNKYMFNPIRNIRTSPWEPKKHPKYQKCTDDWAAFKIPFLFHYSIESWLVYGDSSIGLLESPIFFG